MFETNYKKPVCALIYSTCLHRLVQSPPLSLSVLNTFEPTNTVLACHPLFEHSFQLSAPQPQASPPHPPLAPLHRSVIPCLSASVSVSVSVSGLLLRTPVDTTSGPLNVQLSLSLSTYVGDSGTGARREESEDQLL